MWWIVFEAGDEDAARAAIDELTAKVSDVLNYPEFVQWNALANPDGGPADRTAFDDFGQVDFGADTEADPAENPVGRQPLAVDPVAETSFAGVAAAASEEVTVGEIPIPETPAPAEVPALAVDACDDVLQVLPRDNDGCFSLDDTDDCAGFDELLAEATSDLLPSGPGVEIFTESPVTTVPDETQAVDRLTEFLEQAAPVREVPASAEVETIAGEIGNIVGGDGEDDDADRLYEMGTVYLEMGLFDQACESFEAASRDSEFCARAHEMWGITLQRAGRLPEAIEVLEAGLAATAQGTREQHGLMYHMGQAKEQAGDMDAAVNYFRSINDVDPEYLDVGRRLAKLTTV